jgi:hypothetical protein
VVKKYWAAIHWRFSSFFRAGFSGSLKLFASCACGSRRNQARKYFADYCRVAKSFKPASEQ